MVPDMRLPRRASRSIAVAMLACAPVVVAGCGGGDRPARVTTASGPLVRSAEHDARERQAVATDGTPIAPEPQDVEPNKGTPGAQDATGGKVDVPIRDRRFTPRVMRLKVGQIVVFTNEDDVPHTVRAIDARLPGSGAIPAGGRFEFTPLRPGRVRYHCIIHPDMTGLLLVRARSGPVTRRPRPSCHDLRGTARHELGDLGSEIETHCVQRR
jgi:plastocyanin